MMPVSTALAVAALGGSILALVQHKERVFGAVAALAAALEVLIALRIVQLSVKNMPVTLVLAGAMVLGAGLVLVRTNAKWAVCGATIAVLVGALQILSALNMLH